MICLTDKGRNKLDQVFEQQLQFQSSLFDDLLTKEEQKILLTLMTKVQKIVRKKLHEQRGEQS